MVNYRDTQPLGGHEADGVWIKFVPPDDLDSESTQGLASIVAPGGYPICFWVVVFFTNRNLFHKEFSQPRGQV